MAGFLYTNGVFQGIDNDGNVVALGTLKFTHSDTGLDAVTYQDSALTIANTNPIVLTASGKANVFLGDSSYDVILKKESGETVWSKNDYISGGKADKETTPIAVDLYSDLAEIDTNVFTVAIVKASGSTWVYQNSIWVPENGTVNIKDFDAKGDGSTDDSTVIQNAINYCYSENKVTPKKLIATNGTFNCSSSIDVLYPMDIDFSENVNFTFDNIASCGFNVDLSASVNNYSLFEMNFGSVYSPALDGMTIPGFPGGQDTSSRVGIAIKITACDRANFKLLTAQGWDDVFHISGSTSGKTTENINIDVNTLDWNTRAFTFNTTNTPLNAIDINVNTLGMAKHQLYFIDGGTGKKTSSLHFKCNGQTFLKEPNACMIYTNGVDILHDSTLFFNWAFACAIAGLGETPPEVVTDFLIPYLGGNASSNGVTTDGNSSIGYFTGTRNHITIGLPYGTPDNLGTFSGLRPSAGDEIRFKITASNFIETNQLILKNSGLYQIGTPIELTETLDEATFNGGIGSALIQNKIYCKATISTDLDNNAITAFYLFHQNINCERNIALNMYPYRSTLNGTFYYAETESGTNRAVKVVIKNTSGTTMPTGTEFFFYLEI